MSGAHDQARDAAQRLYEKLNGSVAGDYDIDLETYRGEIETLAQYLGVEQDQPKARIEHTFEIWFAADHEVDDAEMAQYLGHMPSMFPGSQRARRVGLAWDEFETRLHDPDRRLNQ